MSEIVFDLHLKLISVCFPFQGTESEQDSRSNSDPHSFVNHYANVNSTFRHTWKKQKPVAVPVPRAGTALVSGNSTTGRNSHAGTLREARSGANSSMASSSRGGAVGGAIGGAIGGSAAHQLASTNPRGYSSFTESDQDGSSAVVSLNGTQIVMNNMARSRAPLPGFSSFV